MITITNVTARNFLSIGNTTQAVRLDGKGLTLVLGRNADIGQANSRNGVGKTTMLQAVSFGLFNEPLADIKLDNLINNINGKGMLVTLEFERDGVCYRIERGRKPNVLRFFGPGPDGTEQDLALGENKNTQAEIERLIGMGHLLFQHVVGMNTYTVPFLKLKAAQQREVIEELLGITLLSRRAEALALQIKATREIVRDAEAKIRADTDANARIEQAMLRAEADRVGWNERHQITMDELRRKVSDCDRIDFAAEMQQFDALDAWIEGERELRLAADAERREAAALSREAEGLAGEMNRKKRELTQAGDARIDRLIADAKRARDDAAKPFEQGGAVQRLLMEAERADRDAARTDNPVETRLLAEVRRIEAAAQRKQMEADERRAELTRLTEEASQTDAVCATCGQSLDGTDHQARAIEALTAQALKAEKLMRLCESERDALHEEERRVLAEVATARAEFLHAQESSRSRASAARDEIERERAGHAQQQADLLARAETINAEVEAAQQALDTASDALRAEIDTLQGKLDVMRHSVAEREEMADEIASAIGELGARPVPAFASREALIRRQESCAGAERELAREQARENPHDAHIESLATTLSVIDTGALDEASLLLRHQEFMNKLLTGKDSFVRRGIINDNLTYLNGQMNSYLDKLGLPHEVRVMSDLSVEITKMARDYDFAQLSRGEMNRVMLACSFAFRDVWESLNTTMNLLFVDEMADTGLDESGAEASLAILTAMAMTRSVFLISHKEGLMGKVNRILLVTKENEFTRFSYDEDI